jgi:hypothetical protein
MSCPQILGTKSTSLPSLSLLAHEQNTQILHLLGQQAFKSKWYTVPGSTSLL